MSRLYASIDADASKTQATRRAHKHIEAHVRGWDSGVKVRGYIDKLDREVLEVTITGGSNNSTVKELLCYVVNGVPYAQITDTLDPGQYDSDDLDRIVVERDREAGR